MFVHPLRFSKAIEATYVEFVRSLKCEGTMFHVCASFSLSPPTYKISVPGSDVLPLLSTLNTHFLTCQTTRTKTRRIHLKNSAKTGA
jgi:hypothetical protein